MDADIHEIKIASFCFLDKKQLNKQIYVNNKSRTTKPDRQTIHEVKFIGLWSSQKTPGKANEVKVNLHSTYRKHWAP